MGVVILLVCKYISVLHAEKQSVWIVCSYYIQFDFFICLRLWLIIIAYLFFNKCKSGILSFLYIKSFSLMIEFTRNENMFDISWYKFKTLHINREQSFMCSNFNKLSSKTFRNLKMHNLKMSLYSWNHKKINLRFC